MRSRRNIQFRVTRRSRYKLQTSDHLRQSGPIDGPKHGQWFAQQDSIQTPPPHNSLVFSVLEHRELPAPTTFEVTPPSYRTTAGNVQQPRQHLCLTGVLLRGCMRMELMPHIVVIIFNRRCMPMAKVTNTFKDASDCHGANYAADITYQISPSATNLQVSKHTIYPLIEYRF